MQHYPFTKHDLIERFSISLSKIDKSMKQGELKYIKVGKSAVRFSQENIREYIKQND
tara:strand:+ start:1049 stop:1219 length:171 start_codon:yes stop_codon:yes gene_type:complete